MEKEIATAMDEFYQFVIATPSTDAAEALARLAAAKPTSVSIQALARLYVLAASRARFIK